MVVVKRSLKKHASFEVRSLDVAQVAAERKKLEQLQSQNYELARAHSLQGKKHQALEAAFRTMAATCAEQAKLLARERSEKALLLEQIDNTRDMMYTIRNANKLLHAALADTSS